eukprot:2457696-Prymnesium_polylepis.1
MRSPPVWCAVRRYSSATRLCGASASSGTGYVSLRGLIGSRPVPLVAAPTRPRLCRGAGSSVGAPTTGCWAGRCA